MSSFVYKLFHAFLEYVNSGYVYPLLRGDPPELQGFFLENRRPIWRPKGYSSDEGSGYSKYGELDLTQFSELEMRMYILIKARLASKLELETVYTLDEALKLYALYCMETDIERAQVEEIKNSQKK